MIGRATEGLTLKAALLLGFGLTLGLWVFTGYDIASRLNAMQQEATLVTARYTRAQELLSTVRAQVLLGSVYVRDALLDPDPDREREIFQLIAEGKTNKDIAALLSVSPSTVETHRAHIMDKLDLHSAAEIVLYAVRKGVIR